MEAAKEKPISDTEVRTHLAWIRTVLVGMGIGFAAVSAALAVWATISYRRTILSLA